MGNDQSIVKKLIKSLQTADMDLNFVTFTETWPTDLLHMDSHVSINGFRLLRGDQNVQSRRTIGGCACLYANEKRCHPSNVTKTPLMFTEYRHYYG